MQKKYRLDDRYIKKLEEIKKYISNKTEYKETKVYDATVMKIIIDYYHNHIKEGYVSEAYIDSLSERLNERLVEKIDRSTKLFESALEHYKKEMAIGNMLISSVLNEVSTEEEALNVNDYFIQIAKEIVEEKFRENKKDNTHRRR